MPRGGDNPSPLIHSGLALCSHGLHGPRESSICLRSCGSANSDPTNSVGTNDQGIRARADQVAKAIRRLRSPHPTARRNPDAPAGDSLEAGVRHFLPPSAEGTRPTFGHATVAGELDSLGDPTTVRTKGASRAQSTCPRDPHDTPWGRYGPHHQPSPTPTGPCSPLRPRLLPGLEPT